LQKLKKLSYNIKKLKFHFKVERQLITRNKYNIKQCIEVPRDFQVSRETINPDTIYQKKHKLSTRK
jgi:hypothetical protein